MSPGNLLEIIPADLLDTLLYQLTLCVCYCCYCWTVSYAGEVCSLTMRHLVHICVDDIVVVEGRENVVGATLSVLGVVFPSWQEHVSLLVTGIYY